jgi:hypothetical protein
MFLVKKAKLDEKSCFFPFYQGHSTFFHSLGEKSNLQYCVRLTSNEKVGDPRHVNGFSIIFGRRHQTRLNNQNNTIG